MLKICVLGNSQAACLKRAWDVPANRLPRYELTFFAAFGLSARNLEIDGRRLVPSTGSLRQKLIYTAGRSEVDVPAYDVFLICGVGLMPWPTDARLSRQVLQALNSDRLRASPAYALAGKVRRITDAPIYLMHSPLFDERTAEHARFEAARYADYFPLMEQALDIPNSHLLKQPEETVTQGHYTKLEFSIDAARLATSDATEGIQHKDDDYKHMNAAYGAVRLKDFFERLAPA